MLSYKPVVLADNFAPTIVGADSILITLGKEFSYVVTVNDSNGDDVTISTNIPSSIVRTDENATIRATVTNTTAFKFFVTVKVGRGSHSCFI